MQIVIDISEDDYRKVQDGRASVSMMRKAIRNGTPLPEGHWILTDKKEEIYCHVAICSVCGRESINEGSDEYCSCCGAKMESEDEEDPMNCKAYACATRRYGIIPPGLSKEDKQKCIDCINEEYGLEEEGAE